MLMSIAPKHIDIDVEFQICMDICTYLSEEGLGKFPRRISSVIPQKPCAEVKIGPALARLNRTTPRLQMSLCGVYHNIYHKIIEQAMNWCKSVFRSGDEATEVQEEKNNLWSATTSLVTHLLSIH